MNSIILYVTGVLASWLYDLVEGLVPEIQEWPAVVKQVAFPLLVLAGVILTVLGTGQLPDVTALEGPIGQLVEFLFLFLANWVTGLGRNNAARAPLLLGRYVNLKQWANSRKPYRHRR